ncbi:hypothetical protein VXJ36_23405 [Pseudomonas nitroreducens]
MKCRKFPIPVPLERRYTGVRVEVLEIEMREIVDFASVLMKLVIILTLLMMAGSFVVLPDRAGGFVPSMLMLIAPLFVLATLLDLASLIRSRSVGGFLSKQSRRG